MKTSEILQLDCRSEDNKQLIQKALRQVKNLSNNSEEDIPLVTIEKLILMLSKKYQMCIWEITPDVRSNSKAIIWRVVVTDDVSIKDLGHVYGVSMYEALAKCAIYMLSIRNKVGERR